MDSTYSFLDLSGAVSHPNLGAYTFTGEGVGEITVSMDIDKTVHSVGADGSVMVSKIAGDPGTITVHVQQTSDLHKWLLAGYNSILLGDTSMWAAMAILLRNTSDGTSHIASGVSFQKVPDKSYQAQGQMVAWVLKAANLQSLTG